MMLCIFHREKTPSLRIWRDGRFICYGCQEQGFVQGHPELMAVFNEVHRIPPKQLEEAGQLRLPGIE